MVGAQAIPPGHRTQEDQMSISRRTRTVAVLATAALVPTAAIGVGSAVAQSGDTTTTTQSGAANGPRGHGPDTAKLAAKLGVSETQLKAAMDATRPTGKPPTGDPGAGLANDIAKALGVSTDKVKTILDANRPAKSTTRPAPGTRPDMSGLVSALSSGLGIDKATVQAALDKQEAAHKADHTARDAAMAAALAKQLNLDTATVQSALTALRPAGRP